MVIVALVMAALDWLPCFDTTAFVPLRASNDTAVNADAVAIVIDDGEVVDDNDDVDNLP